MRDGAAIRSSKTWMEDTLPILFLMCVKNDRYSVRRIDVGTRVVELAEKSYSLVLLREFK